MKLKKSVPKKEVTSEEVILASNNPDNKSIIRSVLDTYKGLINPDDLEICGLHAVWRALQSHRTEFNQKFTSSLYRFLRWECGRELKRIRRAKKNMVPLSTMGDLPWQDRSGGEEHREKMMNLHDCFRLMHPEQVELLQEYYIYKWTMDEIASFRKMCKQAVSAKIANAVTRLKQLCEEIEEPVYSSEECQ